MFLSSNKLCLDICQKKTIVLLSILLSLFLLLISRSSRNSIVEDFQSLLLALQSQSNNNNILQSYFVLQKKFDCLLSQIFSISISSIQALELIRSKTIIFKLFKKDNIYCRFSTRILAIKEFENIRANSIQIDKSKFNNNNIVDNIIEIVAIYILVDILFAFKVCKCKYIFVAICYKINKAILYILDILDFLYYVFETNNQN